VEKVREVGAGSGCSKGWVSGEGGEGERGEADNRRGW